MKDRKGNIQIDKTILNKYKTVNEIFDKEENIKIINIDNVICIFSNCLEKLKISEIKKLAKLIFEKNHKDNFFYNDGYKILVSKSGIDESITKIFESRQQKELLQEHLIIFSILGLLLENSKLVNQCIEIKGREKYNHWNYYFCCL